MYLCFRSGAISGYRLWRQVHKGLDIPVFVVVLSTLINCLLALIYLGSSAAFNSFTGVATICLSASYGRPILVSIIRGRNMVRNATLSPGSFGYAINIVAVIRIVSATVLFRMPTALPVSSSKYELCKCCVYLFCAYQCRLVPWVCEEAFQRPLQLAMLKSWSLDTVLETVNPWRPVGRTGLRL